MNRLDDDPLQAIVKPNGHRSVEVKARPERVRWSRLGLVLLVGAIAIGGANLWVVTHHEPVVVHDTQVRAVTPAACVRAVDAADDLVTAITNTTLTANVVSLQAAIDGASKGVVAAVEQLTERTDDITGLATRYDAERIECLNTT